jgi:hypothetical protein
MVAEKFSRLRSVAMVQASLWKRLVETEKQQPQNHHHTQEQRRLKWVGGHDEASPDGS